MQYPKSASSNFLLRKPSRSRDYHPMYVNPEGIRSHDPLLQSPRWQVETIPVDRATRAPLLTKVTGS
jgi:hypothetical protein